MRCQVGANSVCDKQCERQSTCNAIPTFEFGTDLSRSSEPNFYRQSNSYCLYVNTRHGIFHGIIVWKKETISIYGKMTSTSYVIMVSRKFVFGAKSIM